MPKNFPDQFKEWLVEIFQFALCCFTLLLFDPGLPTSSGRVTKIKYWKTDIAWCLQNYVT